MRVHDSPIGPFETLAEFAGDAPGGTQIVCDCGVETFLKYHAGGTEGHEECCSGCGKFFVYRPWWEW